MSTPHIDTFHMGRSSIDLYSADVGSPFPDIERFAAYVGGSPTNISVGIRRLGLDSALLTGIGEDPVGDFVLAFLDREGVITEYIPRKPANRTSAVVLVFPDPVGPTKATVSPGSTRKLMFRSTGKPAA